MVSNARKKAIPLWKKISCCLSQNTTRSILCLFPIIASPFSEGKMINKLLGSSYECCSRKIIDGDAAWPGFNPDLGFRLELSDLSEKRENNWDPHSTHSYQWCKQSVLQCCWGKKHPILVYCSRLISRILHYKNAKRWANRLLFGSDIAWYGPIPENKFEVAWTKLSFIYS